MKMFKLFSFYKGLFSLFSPSPPCSQNLEVQHTIFALISQILNMFLRYNNWQSLTIVDKCKIWWLTFELMILIFTRFKILKIINNKIINLKKKWMLVPFHFLKMPTNSRGKNMSVNGYQTWSSGTNLECFMRCKRSLRFDSQMTTSNTWLHKTTF